MRAPRWKAARPGWTRARNAAGARDTAAGPRWAGRRRGRRGSISTATAWASRAAGKPSTRSRWARSTPSARARHANKKARSRGPFSFQLRFLVDDVLARLRIVLLDLELVGRGALVLGGGVEMAGAGRGFELDFLSHGLPAFTLGCGLDLGEDRFHADLVDTPQARGGHAQAYPADLALDPEAAVVEIRLEGADRLVVRVRDEVALHRLLAGDLTNAGHRVLRYAESGGFYYNN